VILVRAPAIAAALGVSVPAWAGGMELPFRGVRALERAGAFVAGADDADALWQNPAGLAHVANAGMQMLLFDAGFVDQPVTYTRADAAGTMYPTVSNQAGGQIIPTVAGAIALADGFVIAGGISAPYAALHHYDDAGPQRYASVSWTGSRFVVVTAGAAYAITPSLRVGATLQDMVSTVSARIVASGCTGAIGCVAEDPSRDALIQIDQTDYIAPSGSLGIQYDAAPSLTLGATFQAPTRVSGTGTLALQLPPAGFTGATVSGNQGSLSFTVPASLRAGVEWHDAHLRVEAALDVELWSEQDAITIAPDNVHVDSATGSIAVAAMTIPRHYRNSYAPAIGVEYRTGAMMLGAGYSYETAAAPPGTVSVLTVDAAKHIVGLGGGYDADGWQIGAAVGFAKLADVDVSIADAQVTQLQPLRDPPTSVVVNAGRYASSYILAGLRFARRF
jgi:long-chain fatty acid transport protein